jgi:hypothetical protein
MEYIKPELNSTSASMLIQGGFNGGQDPDRITQQPVDVLLAVEE